MELCKGGELSLKLREKTYFKEAVRLRQIFVLHFMLMLSNFLLMHTTGSKNDHETINRSGGVYA